MFNAQNRIRQLMAERGWTIYPDTELCGALVAEIIVESNDTLRFRLHNGLELRESIERTVR